MHYYLTEGLGGVEPRKFRGPKTFMKAIQSQANELCSGKTSQQYAVFAPVNQDQLAVIDRIHRAHFRGHHFLYFDREETLIVKLLAGPVPGLASQDFGGRLDNKIREMGLFEDIGRTESATFKGNGSEKEADCSWRPWTTRPLIPDWPTLVIESGISQSRDRLVADAHWWLENSGGQVKIVLVISFSQSEKEIRLQQWELVTIPDPHATQGQPGPTITAPAIIREIDLVAGVPNKASLTLNFENIFLRPPAEGEGDFIFSPEELERYSTKVWKFGGYDKKKAQSKYCRSTLPSYCCKPHSILTVSTAEGVEGRGGAPVNRRYSI